MRDRSNDPTMDNLTVRDWLAGLALQGMLAFHGASVNREPCILECYAYADALLREGDKDAKADR